MKILGILLLVVCTISCKKKNINNNPTQTNKMIIGFNQNWSFFPAFNNAMLGKINQLKPQMVRYPGGTVTHDWDWVTGTKNNSPNATPHPISDVKLLVQATNTKVVFVLDIVNRTITDQLAMLQAINNLGMAIEYIELGNELYANDAAYIAAFPSGTEYAIKANQWIPQIRAAFPNVKISTMLQCRNAEASNQRFAEWNAKVVANTINNVDAFTYHIYISPGGSFASRKQDYEAVVNVTNTASKELWITEYGNLNSTTDPNYYKSLDSLANFVEALPKVTIALNHLIVGNNQSKITADGTTFTQEGQQFLLRANSR
jgi:hypothetical protein